MASITPRRSGPAPGILSKSPSLSSTTTGTPTTTTTTSSSTSVPIISPNNKFVIRLLPPSLTESEFLNQLATYYPYHASKICQFYYIQGHYPKTNFEVPIYSRAYVNFSNQHDSLEFLNFLKEKPFENEFDSIIPVIEKALFHKMVDTSANTSQKTLKESKKNLKRDDLVNNEIYNVYQQ